MTTFLTSMLYRNVVIDCPPLFILLMLLYCSPYILYTNFSQQIYGARILHACQMVLLRVNSILTQINKKANKMTLFRITQ